MSKTRTSFALSQEALDMLKKIAENENRSQANMLEVLILERAKQLEKPKK